MWSSITRRVGMAWSYPIAHALAHRSTRRVSRPVIDSSHASQGHLLAQLDALAVAYVPLLLQVLLVRDAPGASVHAGRSDRDPRWRGEAQRQGAARADRREAGGQCRRRRAAGRARARGLHGVRRLDMRARARARPLAAHEPWGALPC